MRREVLWRSVRRALGDGVELLDVAFLWRRHRLVVPLVLTAVAVGGGAALVAGFGVASTTAVAMAAVVVAAWSATEYRVLAVTSDGLVMMRGGRVRQVATTMIAPLPSSTTVERVAHNLVISEWRVGDERYSVLRRFESTMAAIAAEYPR